MKLFGTKPEIADMTDVHEVHRAIHRLETTLSEIRHSIGRQRTVLKNADKKLQEFQDTLYAMLIEEEHPSKKPRQDQQDDDEPLEF